MEINDIIQKVQNINMTHYGEFASRAVCAGNAEHAGKAIIYYGKPSFAELKKMYIAKLHSLEMMDFLNDLLEYAGRLVIEREVLIGEEQLKAQSLLENIQVLSEQFGLEYNQEKYKLLREKLKQKYDL